MSIEANKAIVRDFWETFSAGRYAAALDMLADDATWLVQGTTALSGSYTKAQFEALLGDITPQAPNGIRVTPKVMTAEADRVSVEAESYGEITNGKIYQNSYHFMFVIRDGKITAVREYLDTEHVTDVFGS